MKKISGILSVLVLFLAGACSNKPSTQKLREVKDFSFSIETSSFASESGFSVEVTPGLIKVFSLKSGNADSVSLKISEEQTNQLRTLLNRLPLDKLEPRYENSRVTDGGAISFDFTLDGKNYKVSYVNYPLNPNLEELKETVKSMFPKGKYPALG